MQLQPAWKFVIRRLKHKKKKMKTEGDNCLATCMSCTWFSILTPQLTIHIHHSSSGSVGVMPDKSGVLKKDHRIVLPTKAPVLQRDWCKCVKHTVEWIGDCEGHDYGVDFVVPRIERGKSVLAKPHGVEWLLSFFHTWYVLIFLRTFFRVSYWCSLCPIICNDLFIIEIVHFHPSVLTVRIIYPFD